MDSDGDGGNRFPLQVEGIGAIDLMGKDGNSEQKRPVRTNQSLLRGQAVAASRIENRKTSRKKLLFTDLH
jgi:hypothetical protein